MKFFSLNPQNPPWFLCHPPYLVIQQTLSLRPLQCCVPRISISTVESWFKVFLICVSTLVLGSLAPFYRGDHWVAQVQGWCNPSHLMSATMSQSIFAKTDKILSHPCAKSGLKFHFLYFSPSYFLIFMSSFVCCLMYPIRYSGYAKPLDTLHTHALSYIWFFAHALPPLSLPDPYPHGRLSLLRINSSLPGSLTLITIHLASWSFVWGNVTFLAAPKAWATCLSRTIPST